MSKVFIKKKLFTGLSAMALATMLACSYGVGVEACETVKTVETVETAEAITPRSAIIGWRYKGENGRIYRRQYNYTEQCWIGEWELCP